MQPFIAPARIGMDDIMFICLGLTFAMNLCFHLGRLYERGKHVTRIQRISKDSKVK